MTDTKKGKTHVLVVEDSPTQSVKLEQLLLEHGYAVSVAENGRKAIESLKDRKPDLIISDIMMPLMDGYALCRAVKADKVLREIPVILLTGLSDPGDVINGLKSGADNFLTKPYKDDFLLSRVEHVLTNRELRKSRSTEHEHDIYFAGEIHHNVALDCFQVTDLLLSTFENAVQKNRELDEVNQQLIATSAELQKTNQDLLQLTRELDGRVEERTEELRMSEEELRRHRDHLQELVEEKLWDLQVSEGRFRSLVMTIPDIVYRVDDKGYFVFVNDAVKRLGYESEELIGCHFSEIIFPADVGHVSRSAVLPRYAGRVTGDLAAPKLFDERRTGKRRTTGLEVRLVTKDRKREKLAVIESLDEGEIIAEVNSSGLYEVSPRGKGSTIVGTVGVIRDITDRKLMERELKNSYDELEIKVLERTADLAKAKGELEEAYEALKKTQNQLIQAGRLAAVGQLAAGVAHEIRNPVNIISLKLQVLESTEPLTESIKNAFDVCRRQVDRVVKISDGLRKFSRPQEKKMALVDIKNIIENVITLNSPRIKTENIALEVIHDPAIPPLLLDENGFEQVLFNLLSNAMDAMEGKEERRLRILTEKSGKENDGRCVRITVSDTGHGISEGDVHKLFDPFFTTKDPDKGTGIGLSISYGIINDHGGRIWAGNNKWGGASFFIELPMAAGQNEDSESR